jgi:hypothetical protein
LTAPVSIVVVLRHVDAVFEGGVEGAFKVLTGCVERCLNVVCGVKVVHAKYKVFRRSLGELIGSVDEGGCKELIPGEDDVAVI